MLRLATARRDPTAVIPAKAGIDIDLAFA